MKRKPHDTELGAFLLTQLPQLPSVSGDASLNTCSSGLRSLLLCYEWADGRQNIVEAIPLNRKDTEIKENNGRDQINMCSWNRFDLVGLLVKFKEGKIICAYSGI